MFEPTKWTSETMWPDVMRRFWDVEPSFRTWATTFQPAVDLSETEKGFKMIAEIPGVKMEGVGVTIEGHTLTISGEKKEAVESEKEGVYHSERRYGRFVRTFTLPERVDTKKVVAAYADGVLEVTLPKLPDAQPQKIAIGTK